MSHMFKGAPCWKVSNISSTICLLAMTFFWWENGKISRKNGKKRRGVKWLTSHKTPEINLKHEFLESANHPQPVAHLQGKLPSFAHLLITKHQQGFEEPRVVGALMFLRFLRADGSPF